MMKELGRRIWLALVVAVGLVAFAFPMRDAGAGDGTVPKPIGSAAPSGGAGAAGTGGAALGATASATTPSTTPVASGACGSDVNSRAKCIKEFAELLHKVCSGSAAASLESVCKAFCSSDANQGVPICSLAGNDPALLAVANSAWSDFERVKSIVHAELEKLESIAKAMPTDADKLLVAARPSAATGAAGSADAAADFAVRALQGLAKLIADRAKAETITWVLDQLGDEACPARDDADDEGSDAERREKLVKRELAVHWIPSLCQLARQQRLGKYGGGAALLAQLKAAIQSDLAGWPGAAAGTVPATLFWLDGQTGKQVYLPGCRSKNIEPWAVKFCAALDDIRFSTKETVRGIVEGRDPINALAELGASFDETNTRPLGNEKPKKVTSVRLQMVACSLALPRDFKAVYGASEAWSVPGAGTPGLPVRAQASVLAVLAQAKACWHLVGQGFPLEEWGKWGKPVSSVEGQVERISTIVRIRDRLGAGVGALPAHVAELVAAKKALDEARKGVEDAFAKLEKTEVPDLSKAKVDDPDGVLRLAEAYRSATAGLILGPAQTKLAKALVRLAEVATLVGQDGISIVGGLLELGVVPGHATDAAERVRSAHAALEDLSAAFAAIRALLEQQYAPLASQVLAFLERRTTAGQSDASTHAESPARQLSRVVTLVTAIASARDSDGIAEAIDAVASPVGAWRGKGEGGARTLSLTAHAGAFAAAEWRSGTYGVVRERMSQHWQAPALALPVGIEVAWGFDCPIASPFALFFPLLDPAAFLQYDAEKDGRLPGASIKTALSPGLGLRFGIQNTPFSVMPEFVYRPGFRQWDSKFGGTGADAFQVGVLLAVDVTLFQLSRKGGS